MGNPYQARILTAKEKFCLDAAVINDDWLTAYLLSRETPSSSNDIMYQRKMASRWKALPVVQEYLSTQKMILAAKSGVNRKPGEARSRQDVIDELNLMADMEPDVKKRLDILAKIADIERMKQAEDKKEEDQTYYFIPQACYDCRLFLEEQKRMQQEKEEETRKGGKKKGKGDEEED